MTTLEQEFMLTAREMNEGKELLYTCDFAVVCFCPLPKTFLSYKYETYTVDNDNRPFTHVKSNNIMYCFSEGFTFLVLSEVYGIQCLVEGASVWYLIIIFLKTNLLVIVGNLVSLHVMRCQKKSVSTILGLV